MHKTVSSTSEYVCPGSPGCCSIRRPCLVGEGECRYHWECAGDLFCGRANCMERQTGRRFDCCHRLNPRPDFTLPVTCTVHGTKYATREHPCGLDPKDLP